MFAARGLQVSRAGVRRFLLDAQDLRASHHYRPTIPATTGRVLREIQRLEAVQLDPVSAVERNQHLVLAARVSGYTPPLLEHLLARRQIFEYSAHTACVFPIETYPIFEGKRRQLRQGLKPYLNEIRSAARAILARLERAGPLPARAFVTTRRVRGWWDTKGPKTKITSHALDILWRSGKVMVVRRQGLERFFDLPERAVPAAQLRKADDIDPDEANDALLLMYLRAHRVFDLSDWAFGWRRIQAPQRRVMMERLVCEGTVVPLSVEGIRRQYFILSQDSDRLLAHDRAVSRERGTGTQRPIRFLAPLDNLLWRRDRLTDFFDFNYTWEVYVLTSGSTDTTRCRSWPTTALSAGWIPASSATADGL